MRVLFDFFINIARWACFLPAILEFLSTVSYNEALSWIKQAEPALRAIDRKLLDVSSPWLAVTDSLLSLSKRVAA